MFLPLILVSTLYGLHEIIPAEGTFDSTVFSHDVDSHSHLMGALEESYTHRATGGPAWGLICRASSTSWYIIL